MGLNWLAYLGAGVAVYVLSVVVYFRANPAGHYSLRGKSIDEPILSFILRLLGFAGILLGAITFSREPGQSWTGLLVIPGGFAIPFLAAVIGNEITARRRAKSLDDGPDAF